MNKFLLAFATIVACVFAVDAQVYLRGDMNGWGTEAAWEFSTDDGVNYVLRGVEIGAGVKFKIADADWSTVNYGRNNQPNIGEWCNLVYGGADMTINYDGADVAPIDVYFNLEQAAMVIVWAGTPAPELGDKPDASAIYLRGGMNDWGTGEEWMFKTTDNKIYTLENVYIGEGIQFKIADENWQAVDLGIAEGMVTLNTTVQLVSQGKNMVIDYQDGVPSGVNLTLDLEALTLYVTSTTGISSVAAETVAPVYYNMQGVKVDNPASGNIYIIRSGDKVQKTIVR